MRATRESWKIRPCPETREELGFRETYTQAEFDRLTEGLIPDEMEDKWFIFFEDPWLFAHRSWTGICIYGVRFERTAAGASAVESWVNRDKEQYKGTRTDYDRAVLTFLIDALLLNRPCSFPVPTSLPYDSPEGLFQHVVVGRAYPEVEFQTVPMSNPQLPASSTEQLLTDMQQDLARAWVTGDRAFIERTIAGDWTAIGPNGMVTTRAQLLAPIFEQRIQTIDLLEIEDVHVRVHGESAVVTGRTHTVGRVNDVAYDVRLRFTDVFAKRDGQWQAIASHASLLTQ